MTKEISHFSSLTPEEFFRLNEGKIDERVVSYVVALSEKVEALKYEIERSRKILELSEEQVSFGRELVLEIDEFASDLPNKKFQQYQRLRENSYFET